MKKIIYLLITFVVICGLCCGCGSKNNSGQTNTENVKGSNIVQVGVASNYILMLDNKGNLYFYGKYPNGISNTEEPKVVATDVKYFVLDGRLLIVKNDNTAYYSGTKIDGWGVVTDFEKVTDNVKYIASNSFCFFIVDNDNNYIVRGPINNATNMIYCSLPKEYDGNFSKIASNVKGIESGSFDNGYITNDNELYVTLLKSPGYQKILSNVDKTVGKVILTEDDKIYIIDEYSLEIAKKLDDNVSEVYNSGGYYYLYKKNDNKYYSISTSYVDSIKELAFPNIKTPYFYDGKRFVYLNTNNKLVLAKENDNTELDLSSNSIKKIYDFLQ
jgi:hypothetical protein